MTTEDVSAEGVTTERGAGRGPKGGGARLKAAAVLAAVFLLGAAAGAGAGRLSAMRDIRHMMEGPPSEARARMRIEAMRRHLDLSDDQVTKIRAVMEEADAEREKLMASCGPGLDELRRRTDDRVREILNDEQRRRFNAAQRRHPHGPPPPPPL